MTEDCRFFVSYSGARLPLTLVGPIGKEDLANRNTFIRAFYDAGGALKRIEKVVYGEVELAHHYEYHDNGMLRLAEIAMFDEEVQSLGFDATGRPILSAERTVSDEGADG